MKGMRGHCFPPVKTSPGAIENDQCLAAADADAADAPGAHLAGIQRGRRRPEADRLRATIDWKGGERSSRRPTSDAARRPHALPNSRTAEQPPSPAQVVNHAVFPTETNIPVANVALSLPGRLPRAS